MSIVNWNYVPKPPDPEPVSDTFPEEPLDLPVSLGGGYYSGQLGTTVSSNSYLIVRKLGYGPRSSTWLVKESGRAQYHALKVFKASASNQQEADRFYTLVRAMSAMTIDPNPRFMGYFWEESSHGRHLCFLMAPHCGLSIEDIRQANTDGRLPVHTTQYILSAVADTLLELHAKGKNIMHGSIAAENIVFGASSHPQHLDPLLTKPEIISVKGTAVVRSQPIPARNPQVADSMETMALNWRLLLTEYKYGIITSAFLRFQRLVDCVITAQKGLALTPEPEHDYGFAPETLLSTPSCSPKTDIWMLGVMLFKLLTGRALFTPTGTAAERLAEMCEVLEAQIPESWLHDKNLKDYSPGTRGLQTLKGSLEAALPQDQAESASSILMSCLCLDPATRISAADLVAHEWIRAVPFCDCFEV
ncbi:CMGC/SRPK protein kinase [Coprinopsis cinerea AmutBmut pab1-1]|nr:CMGC/SRPK protein kinase [Coprinopsis cinerea AmutBmut pab1-1]